MSRGEVLAVINKHMRRIQACYERQLTTKPSLSGKLTFDWTIKKNGGASGVKQISNTMGDAKVGKCISGVIKRMKFPRPKGGSVRVAFPFIFQRAP